MVFMLRILVFDPNRSDVTDMSVKGWKVSIYRDRDHGGMGGSVTIRKGLIEFRLLQTSPNTVELKKFVDNNCVDTKMYDTDGCVNCEGTVLINDHSDPKRCYAFWRNKELQTLLDSLGVEKMTFAKSTIVGLNKFDYDIPVKEGTEGFDFYTDGSISLEEETGTRKIFGATYVFRKNDENGKGGELIITNGYDINKLSDILLNI